MTTIFILKKRTFEIYRPERVIQDKHGNKYFDPPPPTHPHPTHTRPHWHTSGTSFLGSWWCGCQTCFRRMHLPVSGRSRWMKYENDGQPISKWRKTCSPNSEPELQQACSTGPARSLDFLKERSYSRELNFGVSPSQTVWPKQRLSKRRTMDASAQFYRRTRACMRKPREVCRGIWCE